MISVLIVDDDHLMRAGIRKLLEAAEDIRVAGEASDGDSGVAEARRLRPDVVLMDVRMPGRDGVSATARIVEVAEPPKVVVLTTFELDEYVFDSLAAGASGFLLKRSSPEELFAAIRAVHDEGSILSPSVTRRVVDELAKRRSVPDEVPGLDDLTEREHEVLVAMAEGLSNSEIGDRLFIGENTVKTHVSRVLAKLGARDRVHAVVMAHRAGLGGGDGL